MTRKTKAELEAELAEAQSGLKSEGAKVAALEALVAELEAGVPLPGSGSAATPSTSDLTCFIRVTGKFIFEGRTFQRGMAILSPTKPLLRMGDGCWEWCDEVTFRTSERKLHRTKDGWMAWPGTN